MFTKTNAAATTDVSTEAHTEVTISPLGRVLIEGKNFEGSACSLMGDVIRNKLGGKSGDTSPKPEFFQGATTNKNEQGW